MRKTKQKQQQKKHKKVNFKYFLNKPINQRTAQILSLFLINKIKSQVMKIHSQFNNLMTHPPLLLTVSELCPVSATVGLFVLD